MLGGGVREGGEGTLFPRNDVVMSGISVPTFTWGDPSYLRGHRTDLIFKAGSHLCAYIFWFPASKGNLWSYLHTHSGSAWSQKMTWDCTEGHYCDAMVLLEKLNRALLHTYLLQNTLVGFNPLQPMLMYWLRADSWVRALRGHGFVLQLVYTYFKAIIDQCFCYMLTLLYGEHLGIVKVILKEFCKGLGGASYIQSSQCFLTTLLTAFNRCYAWLLPCLLLVTIKWR